MLRRIELTDFMSHAHTVIDLADGLTVLVGPNNCGKSAVVAALQILCHNENSTYVTRHGARECAVRVETGDGHVVEWRRRGGGPRYTIDGRDYDRLGPGGVPDELHQVLRLPPVRMEGSQEFDVHFGEQKSPVFLLDKPASHAAQFFASSSDAAKLVRMQGLHRQKTAAARERRVRLTAENERVERARAALAPAAELEARVRSAEREFDEMAGRAVVVARLADDAEALRRRTHHAARCELRAGAVARLTAPPPMVPTDPLEQLLARTVRTTGEHAREVTRAAALGGLPPAPTLHDTAAVERLLGDLVALDEWRARLEGDRAALARLRRPPDLVDSAPLARLVAELASATARAQHADRELGLLRPLVVAPQMADVAGLAQVVRDLMRAAGTMRAQAAAAERLASLSAPPTAADWQPRAEAINGLEAAVRNFAALERAAAELAEQAAAAERELREWAAAGGVCPTCGSPLDPEELVRHLAGGAAGHSHA